MQEAVGVFDNPENLNAAIAELEITAFPRHDISVMGDSSQIARQFGNVSPEWLEDSSETPRTAPMRPEEKALGASIIVGGPAYVFGCGAALMAQGSSALALIGSIAAGSLLGAAVGAVVVFAIRNKMAAETETQLRRGGLVLWVRTPDAKSEQLASNILHKHGGKHIHIHSIS